MRAIMAVARRIIVLDHGQKIAEGSPKEVTSNGQPRPHKAGLENDYPDPSLKPPDAAYPPFADPFSVEQHRLGPWSPIQQWLKGNAGRSATPATRHSRLRRSVRKATASFKPDDFPAEKTACLLQIGWSEHSPSHPLAEQNTYP
jgi:hypothetical protein